MDLVPHRSARWRSWRRQMKGPCHATFIMIIHYVFLIHAYILDIRDGSINKMIPQLIPTNVFPLSVHRQESSYL